MLAMMRRLVIVLVAVGFVLGLSRTAAAQTSQKFPYLAAVTAEKTSVRAGADSRYYPFGSVGKNDLVQVVAQKAGWARVRAVGPAFEGFFGYLKFPKTEAARFRLDREGTQGLTLGSTNIFAPSPGAACSTCAASCSKTSAGRSRPSRAGRARWHA